MITKPWYRRKARRRCALSHARRSRRLPPTRSPAAAMARLPQTARQSRGPITVCPECARIYWPGSHAHWMPATIERWQNAT